MSVDDADVWQGRLRYSVAGLTPPGATLNEETGDLAWTPPLDQPPGRSKVTVTVAGPEGQMDETSFWVSVFKPIPPLILKPIPTQTVEAGKPLNLNGSVENPDAWKGKVRYGIAAPPPGRDDRSAVGPAFCLDDAARPARGTTGNQPFPPAAGRVKRPKPVSGSA